ncbi:peptidylprolyl isomerase [Picosynechococcus sp. PCC 73109]|uniref:peptidylprolyl isomerase n=1 Tax=Picosynechococcus sp. PCC 73109 TaxID=374982 RepID=UPI0007458C6D|nr:peptidylprolyl isomerase [Picosynechococcus sp. PCC 73109]AMA08836.1 peptidylprolyl isomerase [Picosynechococcus sp. PCC 73109]
MERPWQLLCLALLVGSLSLSGCAPTTETSSNNPTATPPSAENYKPRLNCPDPASTETTPEDSCTAVVEMVLQSQSEAVDGQTIRIELNGADAPVTAGNFVDLVSRGVYDGTAFHRVIRTPEPFVVQGGDPLSKDSQVPLNALGRGGFVDPETGIRRDVPLEIKLQGEEQPVYGKAELDPNQVVLKHDKGAIAMARSQLPNSASSQFYFSLGPNDFLNGNYAVFGQITEGLAVIDKIEMGDRIQSARVVEGEDLLVK